MTVQAIVYSKATGRVRRVIDPNASVPNVLAFLAQAKAAPGEGVMAYTKQGNGLDTLGAWQAAVTTLTGLAPSGDRYCIIDGTNKIQGAIFADPVIDSAPPGCILVASDVADDTWTFTPPSTFTPPVAG